MGGMGLNRRELLDKLSASAEERVLLGRLWDGWERCRSRNVPEVSGFQICRDVKQRSALPVLVLTSRDQLRDEVHALELGADEYLTKPYRKERLLARMELSAA